MQDRRLAIPRVNLRTCFNYLLGSAEGISASAKRNIRRFLRLVSETMDVDENRLSELNFLEFSGLVEEMLLKKFGLAEILTEIQENSLPLTPYTLKAKLEARGFQVSLTSSKALLSLLRQLSLISNKRYPVPTLTTEGRLLELLAKSGRITLKEVLDQLKTDPSELTLVVLKLMKVGLLSISGLELPADVVSALAEKGGIPKDMVENLPVGSRRFFQEVEDRSTGETMLKLVLTEDAELVLGSG